MILKTILKQRVINGLGILILTVSGVNANDLSLPSYPVEPSVPQSQESKTKIIQPNLVKAEIIAMMGTNDEVRGYISFPEKIAFKHYRNGLIYDKVIVPEDIQSIHVLEYGKKEESKEGKNTFYQFEPSLVEIKLKDNTSYRIDKIFSALKSFNIETNNGRTRLFTIFGDSYEKSKGWRDVESKDPDYHRLRPHPSSVKKIIFLRIEKE